MSGDFYLIKNYSSLYLTYTGDASHINRRRIGFDASRTCSIYSSSPTVQPPAFQALIIIKIWSAAGWTVFKSLNTELELLAFIFTDIEPVALLPLATRSKYPSLMSFEKTPFPCIWYKFWQPGKYPTFSVPVMFGRSMAEHNRDDRYSWCLFFFGNRCISARRSIKRGNGCQYCRRQSLFYFIRQ